MLRQFADALMILGLIFHLDTYTDQWQSSKPCLSTIIGIPSFIDEKVPRDFQ